MYDDQSFSFYTPCGPYRVGFRDFVSNEMGNECSIFYPAMNDDSGTFGVPYMPWGDEEAKGFHKVVESNSPAFGRCPLFLTAKPMQKISIPVFRNANIAALKQLQPIIFSHGLSGNRMTYSVICRELASCGYFVICLSHDDRSGMYTPKAGPYPS
jgi:hypothetical protein